MTPSRGLEPKQRDVDAEGDEKASIKASPQVPASLLPSFSLCVHVCVYDATMHVLTLKCHRVCLEVRGQPCRAILTFHPVRNRASCLHASCWRACELAGLLVSLSPISSWEPRFSTLPYLALSGCGGAVLGPHAGTASALPIKSFPHPKPRLSIKPLGTYQTHRSDAQKTAHGRDSML